MRGVRDGDAAVREVVHKVALALGEVKVVESWKNKVLVGERVANPEAIQRARHAYRVACQILGHVRQLDGTTEGPQRPDRKVLAEAGQRLDALNLALARLEGLADE